MGDGQVLLADDHLAVIFEYEPEAVAQIKRIPGAKWDRLARVWRVPVASLEQVSWVSAMLYNAAQVLHKWVMRCLSLNWGSVVFLKN